ncbi:polyribonucleotide nucleotidyltransferase 2, mitochondrial-like [Papaver somniferum]|uniref:polyribonucleotide nucleotidyltransferase 2, mitochondrial-like n=1 Tax=Papaver somniferum TaxID=3469 RepID=UPI000E704DC6|nr:polyribonucleotide nucleotidyltransferase 2, mitochondrial-like [Papaver somniferum]
MAMAFALGRRRNATNSFSTLPKNAIRLYQTYKEEFQIGSCCLSFETTPPNQFDDSGGGGGGGGDGVVLTMRDTLQSMLRTNSFPRIIVDYQGNRDNFGARSGGTRIIRTPVRPLFPKGFYHDVQVMERVLCCSEQQDIDVLAANATSAALMLSDIPWGGPIGVVRVGRIQGEFLVNPQKSELACCDIDLIYACTRDKTLMVDVQANDVVEEDLEVALRLAHQEAVKYIDPQIKLADKAGKCKKDYKLSMRFKESTVLKIESLAETPFEAAHDSAAYDQKSKGEEYLAKISGDAKNLLEVEECDEWKTKLLYSHMVNKLRKKIFQRWNVENGIRLDGRRFDEVRRVECESTRMSGLHGSSCSACGVTKVSCTVTQTRPGTDEAEPQSGFVDHLNYYNPIRYPGYLYKTRPFRIEGDWKKCSDKIYEADDANFVENALVALLPKEDIFPYVVRVNSQVVCHDGSASAATVCGVSIALMDAGVPQRKHVADVSLGLLREGSTLHGYRYRILTDLSSSEEQLGDMNLKVAGSCEGITAVQLDLNVAGVTLDIICDCLRPALNARLQILYRMEQEISVPRYCVSNDWLWPYPIVAEYFLPVQHVDRLIDGHRRRFERDTREDTFEEATGSRITSLGKKW